MWWSRVVSACIALLVVATAAQAQSFPDDGGWTPLTRGGVPLGDPATDGSDRGRELVGDSTNGCAYVASDDDYLYLRMRLDTNPTFLGALRPYTWGVELDLDGDLSAYEYVIRVDGTTSQISLAHNTASNGAGDPRDNAEAVLYTGAANSDLREQPASASHFGNTPDVFLDFAMPWSALSAAGLTRTQLVRYIVGTSNNTQGFAIDIAGTMSSPGPGTIADSASDPIPLGLVTMPDGPPDAGVIPTDALDDAVAAPPDAGASPGAGFHVEGGGCASSTPGIGALVCLAGLFVRRRRTLALLALVAPAVAQAQSAQFAVDRFRLATDRGGLLDVEWGAVDAPLSANAAVALGFARDELIAYDAMGNRAGALVHARFGANVAGGVTLTRWLQLAIELPIVLDETGSAPMGLGVAEPEAQSTGDLRIAPKLAVFHGPVDVAVIPAIMLPTASTAYAGERAITFAPEAAVSRQLGDLRFAVNLGAVFREGSELADLRVDDEIYLRAGVGYRLERAGLPAEVEVTTAVATAAASPFEHANTDQWEVLAGGEYDVLPDVSVFAAGGAGIDRGYGTPEWRMLVGSRFRRAPERRVHAAVPAQPPAPPADHDDDGLDDAHDACPLEPEDADAVADDDGCPEP